MPVCLPICLLVVFSTINRVISYIFTVVMYLTLETRCHNKPGSGGAAVDPVAYMVMTRHTGVGGGGVSI